MKPLKRTKRKLYYLTIGRRVYGKHDKMVGNCSNLRGDCSNLSGNCSGLSGDLNEIPKGERPTDLTLWFQE